MLNYKSVWLGLMAQSILFVTSCSTSYQSSDDSAVRTLKQNYSENVIQSSVTVQFNGKADSLSEGEKGKILRVAETTYEEVKEFLPMLTDELDIEIRIDSVYQSSGNSGYAMSPTKIIWIVDPSKGGILEIVDSGMRHTLFHEMHHLVRGWTVEGGKPKTSFMDGVIAEGLAVVFERDFAGSNPPTADYPSNVSEWVDELKRLPIDADYRKWMYFNSDGYRELMGYRAGTYIVDKAMAASGETAVTLVNVPTEEILSIAGIE